MRIKDIPITDRPRERLLEYGAENLSNEELISILLKTGSKKKSVKELSLEVLKLIDNIENLKDITVEKLLTINGIGTTKALELISAVELGKRIFIRGNTQTKIRFRNSNEIYKNTKYLFANKKQEFFYCFYLNNKNEVIERRLLFMGTINRSIVHPREIFKYAYLNSASAIICMHNHPSGDITPSREDIRLTESLVELGKLNAIPVLDHIISSENDYYSFYEDGKIINL